jgi:hypothetical protein
MKTLLWERDRPRPRGPFGAASVAAGPPIPCVMEGEVPPEPFVHSFSRIAE